MFDDLLRYAEMLEGAQKTLDELDERLGEAMLHNAEDECEKWLMDSPTSASTSSAQESGGGETGFTAADIALGVVLNKLSLIGKSNFGAVVKGCSLFTVVSKHIAYKGLSNFYLKFTGNN